MSNFKEFQTYRSENIRNHPGIDELFNSGKIPAQFVGVVPHAEMYEANEAGTTINFTSAGVYVGWTTAIIGLCSSDFLFEENAIADRLRITRYGEGRYKLSCSISFSGIANAIIEAAIFKNGIEQTKLHFDRKLGGGDLGNASFVGYIDLQEHPVYADQGDFIDLRFNADIVPSFMVLEHCIITLERL